ncbi:MAG: RNA polymerase sigma-54 factor, partial [Verrucomicrobia bacterium 21-51-4]
RLFLRRRVPELARFLSVQPEAIHDALEVVASLDPAPGRKFREDTNREVVADVVVEPIEGEWRVSIVNLYIPRLRLSPVYKNMLTEARLNPSEREYIRDKIRSGKLIIDAIEQRQSTLERIAKAIVAAQIDFLETGTRALKPLTLNQIAEVVGLHETTVSRAIANKYMQTPHGLFEFKYFFRGGFTSDDGKEVSSTSVKDLIKSLIEEEDACSPISDQGICELLAQKNLQVARRTVAKYREELGIAPTNLRRQYA